MTRTPSAAAAVAVTVAAILGSLAQVRTVTASDRFCSCDCSKSPGVFNDGCERSNYDDDDAGQSFLNPVHGGSTTAASAGPGTDVDADGNLRRIPVFAACHDVITQLRLG